MSQRTVQFDVAGAQVVGTYHEPEGAVPRRGSLVFLGPLTSVPWLATATNSP